MIDNIIRKPLVKAAAFLLSVVPGGDNRADDAGFFLLFGRILLHDRQQRDLQFHDDHRCTEKHCKQYLSAVYIRRERLGFAALSAHRYQPSFPAYTG